MKQILIMIVLFVSAYSADAQSTQQKTKADQAGNAKQTEYTCPMHTEVVNDKPGKCPKCGMDLVQIKSSANQTKTYTCPMHTEVSSDKPGDCPKCGMQLTEKKGGKKAKKKGMMSCCM